MSFFQHDGARTYYRLEGDPARPAIVLVHPIGADHGFWAACIAGLTRDFCVLTLDLPGHGATDVPAQACTIDSASDMLVALARHAGLERFAICGTSIGGMIALNTASRHPDRVSAVVSCSAAARLAPPPGGWDGRARAALDHGMKPLAGPMTERMFTARFRSDDPAAVASLRHVFEQTDPRGYAGLCEILRDTDLSSAATHIGCPVLVVSGSEDPLSPPAVSEQLAGLMPTARTLRLACGHYPPIEKPAAFVDAVREHCRAA